MNKFIMEDDQRILAERDVLSFVKDVTRNTSDIYHLLGRLVSLKDSSTEILEFIGTDDEWYLYYTYYIKYMENIIDYIRKGL